MTKTDPQPLEVKGLQFPCRYPIKAMGRSGEDFELTVLTLIEKHVGNISQHEVRSKSSSAGKFQSVTVTIEVSSRTELETIYQDLSACEQVLWTL